MKKLLYTGTRSGDSSAPGITIWFLDENTGKLSPAGAGVSAPYAGYADICGDVLYTVTEMDGMAAAASYRINPPDGSLTLIGQTTFPGSASCHVTVWPGGHFLSCSGYMSGDLTVIPTDHGVLGAAVQQIRYSGTGFLNSGRQDAPHIHSSRVSPDRQRLFVCDLGLDVVNVYRIHYDTGLLESDQPETQIHTPQGEGPRHLTFSKDGRFLYLLTELENHCLVYSYDAQTGISRLLQTVDLLPDNWHAFSKAAAIVLSPDGRFLYCSNRGADTIAVFAVNLQSGQLSPVQQASSPGIYPWCLCVDEHFLIAAHHDGNCVTVSRRDPETGRIGEMTDRITVRMASCVTLYSL